MPVDSSKTSSFFDSLRSAVRSAGAEGKCVSLIFTVSLLENLHTLK